MIFIVKKIFPIFSVITLLLLSSFYTQASNSVLFVTGSHSNKAKLSLLSEVAKDKGVAVIAESAKNLDELSAADIHTLFEKHELVVFHGVSRRESQEIYQKYTPLVAASDSRFLAIKWLNGKQLIKGLSAGQAQHLFDYYDNGGLVNFERMTVYLQNRIFAQTQKPVMAAVIYPEVGIYHPDYTQAIFSDLVSYQSWYKNRKNSLVTEETIEEKEETSNKTVIGLLFQRAMIEAGTTDLIDASIRQLEAKGVEVVPFFFELSPKSSDYTPLLKQGNKTVIDLIINFRAIHWASQRKLEFESLGVPVMQALTYYDGNQQHWEDNSQGITPGMSPFLLVLPESAGVVDPIIVAAIND